MKSFHEVLKNEAEAASSTDGGLRGPNNCLQIFGELYFGWNDKLLQDRTMLSEGFRKHGFA